MSSCTLNMYSIPLCSCKETSVSSYYHGNWPHPQISSHWAPSVSIQRSTSEVPSDPRAPLSSSIPQVEQEHEPASWGVHQHTAAWRALYLCTLEDGQWLGKKIQHSCWQRVYHICRGYFTSFVLWTRCDRSHGDREFITCVEDTPLVSCCEQSVITPMHTNNLGLQLGSKFVST